MLHHAALTTTTTSSRVALGNPEGKVRQAFGDDGALRSRLWY